MESVLRPLRISFCLLAFVYGYSIEAKAQIPDLPSGCFKGALSRGYDKGLSVTIYVSKLSAKKYRVIENAEAYLFGTKSENCDGTLSSVTRFNAKWNKTHKDFRAHEGIMCDELLISSKVSLRKLRGGKIRFRRKVLGFVPVHPGNYFELSSSGILEPDAEACTDLQPDMGTAPSVPNFKIGS